MKKTVKHKAAHAPGTEEAFLAKYDPAAFERPSVTVDVVLLTVRAGALYTLLVRRAEHPFKGAWALPGTFVHMTEALEATAERALKTKASLEGVYLEQLATFGTVDRDPRTRVISVAYCALVDAKRFDVAIEHSERSERRERLAERQKEASIGRVTVAWEGEKGGPAHVYDADGRPMPLAFDHEDILGLAIKRIRGKLDYSPIGFQLLPERFTLLDLQSVHETVLGRELNKDSFRRRMLASDDLVATGEMQSGVGHRPAELYRFIARSAL